MNANSERIRQPHFADNRWYSADASKLEADTQTYMGDPPPEPTADKLLGLVAPHAGHLFSGHVAGAGFATLTPGAFKTVILLGPDHRGAAPGQISTVQVDTWRTPLGNIPVARDILDALQTEIDLVHLPSDQEHALEVELPFLQVALKQFNLVPLMMGTQSLPACQTLGAALVNALKTTRSDAALLVASSDLSHFFDDDTARRLDKEINSSQALGATQAHLLKYATSADAYPDKSRVVGYAAVAFTRK